MIYWIFPLAVVLGVGLGLRFRAPAAAAVSVAMAGALALGAVVQNWTVGGAIGVIAAALACLQGGFLASLWLPRR